MLVYGEDILKRYSNNKIKTLYNKQFITIDEAVKLAIGNCILGINAPWWNWHNLDEDFKNDFELPEKPLKTIGIGNYIDFNNKLEIVKEIDSCYTLALIYGSHIEKHQFLRGIENSLTDFAGCPEETQQVLDFIINKNLVMLENIVYIDSLDGVLLGSDWGTQRELLISPTSWRNMIRNGEQKEYDVIKNARKDVWIHSCGNITDIIPDLCEMGVDVLNPIQPECMNIYELKDKYGDKLTFWGGISTQNTLPNGTSNEVREETKKIIEYMSKNGGFITGPSQEIQDDVPIENVFALIDTAKEYL